MIRALAFACLFAGVLAAQNTPQEPGSVSGRVIQDSTGAPLVGVDVMAPSFNKAAVATTDANGRFLLEGVRPGLQIIRVSRIGQREYSGSRRVQVEAGTKIGPVDIQIYTFPTISGRVLDENDEPIEGAIVAAIERSYFMGEVQYHLLSSSLTDDQGNYKITNTDPEGKGVLLWALAWQGRTKLPAISEEPAAVELRRSAFVPTYYPNASRPEEASVIHLRPGEQREDLDIQLHRSPSFCIEATASIPEAWQTGFFIQGTQLRLGQTPSGNNVGFAPIGGMLAPDGKLRLCGLAKGDYRLGVYAGNINSPLALGWMNVTIIDADVKNIHVAALPRLLLPGRTVWANEPPADPIWDSFSIQIASLHRSVGGISGSTISTAPGEFELRLINPIGEAGPPGLVLDEYAVSTSRLPRGVYVKDIRYGGTSVFHRPLVLGSELEGSEVRILVDHNGGSVQAFAVNEDGEAVGDATVVLIPKTAATYLQTAETRTAGLTDQNGIFTSPALEPGEYFAMAVEGDFSDLGVETITALFKARLRAKEVAVGPNATVDVKLEVLRLER